MENERAAQLLEQLRARIEGELRELSDPDADEPDLHQTEIDHGRIGDLRRELEAVEQAPRGGWPTAPTASPSKAANRSPTGAWRQCRQRSAPWKKSSATSAAADGTSAAPADLQRRR